MWIQFFKPILQDISNKWWWSTDDFTCILFDHNRSILTFTHTLWIPNLHFSEIQVQHSAAGNSNLAHSRCPTLPLFVAELQDPLNILLGHWVIIFQRLKGNRRHAVVLFFLFFFIFPGKTQLCILHDKQQHEIYFQAFTTQHRGTTFKVANPF